MGIYYSIEEKYLKAIALMEEDRWAAAKLKLERILEEEPGYVVALVQLGRIYAWKLGDLAHGRNILEAACRIDPDHHYPHMALAYVLKACGDIAALETLTATAVKVPGTDISELYDLLAQTCEQKGFLELAKHYFGKSLYHSSSDYEADTAKEGIERIQTKQKPPVRYRYELK